MSCTPGPGRIDQSQRTGGPVDATVELAGPGVRNAGDGDTPDGRYGDGSKNTAHPKPCGTTKLSHRTLGSRGETETRRVHRPLVGLSTAAKGAVINIPPQLTRIYFASVRASHTFSRLGQAH